VGSGGLTAGKLRGVKTFFGTLLGLFAVIALWIALGSAAFVLVWASDRETSAVVVTVWLLFGLVLSIGYIRWVKRRSAAETSRISADALRARRGLRKDERLG